jgi:FixJ family two-component response regulator
MSIQRKVVAVIDDDPAMLKAVERLLSAMGFDAKTYVSAEAFLESAAASKAECLVLDIHLGGISGIELRRQLAASGSNLPIIFITSDDNESTYREATEAGCVACLHKPFLAKLLIGAIDRATDQLDRGL